MIEVMEGISIPDEELRFTASLSSGPGGQNVNKVSSRITLWFDVVNSPSLSPEQKQRIVSRLASRVSKEGVLRVSSQQSRSQLTNRDIAVERFTELLRTVLKDTPPRKKTRIKWGAKLRRLEEKKQHGILKRGRSKKVPTDD